MLDRAEDDYIVDEWLIFLTGGVDLVEAVGDGIININAEITSTRVLTLTIKMTTTSS